jgi:hypothetical protein
MKTTRKQSQRRDQGYILLLTIVFVGIALLLLGSVMNWTNTTAKQTERNNLFNAGTAAAEAADERVIAQMMRDFYYQTYNSAASYATNLPSQTGWPVQFQFSDGAGGANKTGVNFGGAAWVSSWQALGAQYAGLSAYVIQCTITSTATPTNQPYSVPATVQETIQFDSIPLPQFALFYNMDMEISPGANMTVNGKTFCNGNIWSSPSGNLTFGDTVQTAMNYYHSRNTNCDPQANGSGTITFNVGGGPQTNVPSLVMPVGTNNSAAGAAAILGLPPAGTDPNSQIGQEYLCNIADLVISNSSSGVISTYFQDTNNVNRLTLIPCDITNILANITTNGSGKNKTYTTNYSTNCLYSFATNTTFYDYREKKTVQAVQLNVGALKTWLTSTNGSGYNTQDYNDTGHYINSSYIYNNVPLTSANLPAVRMANGSVLPSAGLSVATPDPIYVLGHYNLNNGDTTAGQTNTANTMPAALMGDSLTILSPNWSDSYSLSHESDTTPNGRTPVNTTVNAATLEGIVVSTNIAGTKYYSGGVENFLRLLENWSSATTVTYNGSIVVMFPSQFATNRWQSPGVYYNVPTRSWGFDVNFKNQTKLPPLEPQVKALQRVKWTVY